MSHRHRNELLHPLENEFSSSERIHECSQRKPMCRIIETDNKSEQVHRTFPAT